MDDALQRRGNRQFLVGRPVAAPRRLAREGALMGANASPASRSDARTYARLGRRADSVDLLQTSKRVFLP
jgi:hypothetical protein